MSLLCLFKTLFRDEIKIYFFKSSGNFFIRNFFKSGLNFLSSNFPPTSRYSSVDSNNVSIIKWYAIDILRKKPKKLFKSTRCGSVFWLNWNGASSTQCSEQIFAKLRGRLENIISRFKIGKNVSTWTDRGWRAKGGLEIHRIRIRWQDFLDSFGFLINNKNFHVSKHFE